MTLLLLSLASLSTKEKSSLPLEKSHFQFFHQLIIWKDLRELRTDEFNPSRATKLILCIKNNHTVKHLTYVHHGFWASLVLNYPPKHKIGSFHHKEGSILGDPS